MQQGSVTQKIYTPSKIAGLIGSPEAQVREEIKAGHLKGTYMENVADFVITHDELLEYLRATQRYDALSKIMTRRILLVDRDAKVHDILKMELGRQGCEIKVATTDREVAFLCRDFRPDVICVHLGATSRTKDPIRESVTPRMEGKPYIVVYHNYLGPMTETPEIQGRLGALGAKLVVNISTGLAPLLDAIRERFGIKTSTAVRRPPPPRA